MKINVTLSIEDTTMDKFREECKIHGMKISPRIETLLEKDIVVLEQINSKAEVKA